MRWPLWGLSEVGQDKMIWAMEGNWQENSCGLFIHCFDNTNVCQEILNPGEIVGQTNKALTWVVTHASG